MFTSASPKTELRQSQSGSALVVAIIVLVLLATLGFAALEVADLNIMSSANDRERKSAFFQADAGSNVGIATIQASTKLDATTVSIAIDSVQETNEWKDSAPDACDNDSALTPRWVGRDGNCAPCQAEAALILENATTPMATYVRVGTLSPMRAAEGSSDLMAQGTPGGPGGGGSTGRDFITEYLIRSKRYGERNSLAEVDTAWHEVH